MDRPEFRARLGRLGYSVADFAAISGYSAKTVADFGGRTPVPHIVRHYLTLIEHIRAHRIPLPAPLADHGQPSPPERPQVDRERLLRSLRSTF